MTYDQRSEWDKTNSNERERVETRFYTPGGREYGPLRKVICAVDRNTGSVEVLYDQGGQLDKTYPREDRILTKLKEEW